MLFVRPEALKISDESQSGNRMAVKPVRRDMEGAFVNWVLSAGKQSFVAHLTKAADALIDHNRLIDLGFSENDAIVMASGNSPIRGARTMKQLFEVYGWPLATFFFGLRSIVVDSPHRRPTILHG